MKNILLAFLLLFSIPVFSQIPPYVSTNGLIAFWPFNGNANDVSGNGNNGTVVGGATLTSNNLGVGNSAYYFPNVAPNCSSSYIQANVNTSSITASDAMTISFWAYRSGDGCIASVIDGFIEFGNCYLTCPGQLQFYWPSSSSISVEQDFAGLGNEISFADGITVADNTWYHIAYSNNGTTIKHYLNGILIQTFPFTSTVQLNGNVTFGTANPPSNGALNGKLFDIGLWSRALSDCEVYALYSGNPSPTFAYNPLPDTTLICDSVTLNAGLDLGGVSYQNYIWSTGANSQTISAKQNGLYKITVTNYTGCNASDSTYVDIIKPTATASKTTACAGDNITLNATGPPGTSQTLVSQFFLSALVPNTHTVPTVIGDNYIMSVSGTWSFHECPGDDFNNPADAAFYVFAPFNPLPNNMDLVQWNGTPVRPDGNTYNPNHTYTYTLPPATETTQTFTFVDPGTYSDNCGGLTFEIYQINKSNVTYTWTANPSANAGLNAANINQQNLTVNPTITTTYYVTVNDGVTICEDSVKIIIATVDTSITINGGTSICTGTNVVLNAGVDNTYKWLLNNATISGATNNTYSAKQAGAYSVAVTNSSGCIDTSRTITISSYPKPVADFTVNNSTQCLNGNSFVFINTSSISNGTLTYLWSFGDGSKAISKDTNYTYTTANNYSVQLISNSDNGCSDTSNKTITVKAASQTPIITAAGPLVFCQNGSVSLTSNEALDNQWYKDGNLISSATNQAYTATAAGEYIVINSSNSCPSDSSTRTVVTVTPTPLTPTITPSGPVSFCENDSVILNSNAATGNLWYLNGIIIPASNGNSYTVSVAGIYSVIAIDNNCPSNASSGITVTINPSTTTPTVTAQGPVSFCESGNVVLASSTTYGNQWYQNGILLTGANDNTYKASTGGVYEVIATDVNSCPSKASDGISISIIPSPEGIRYPTINTSVDIPTELQARAIGNEYLWSPSTDLSETGNATTTFNGSNTTDYIIRITTSAGCYTYDSLLVNVYAVKGILVPTAFTPNGDGLNDILRAIPIAIKQLNYFRIYNRWGELLFETNNPSIGWDGTFQGAAEPGANYVWIAQGIDNYGNIVNEHGQTVLIR